MKGLLPGSPGSRAPAGPGGRVGSIVRRRAGGVATPLVTAVVAFLLGGVVVAATGHNPIQAYHGIFNGAGLNWIFHPTTDSFNISSYNLQQTLLQTTAQVAELRGRAHDYLGTPVICTFHPAFVTKNPKSEPDCWADLELVLRTMGRAVPSEPDA